MDVLSALLIALANNADTISVRVAYSLKRIKVSFGINLWIAFLAFIVSALAAGSGQLLADVLPGSAGSVLSMGLLILVGLWLIAEPFVGNKQEERRKGNRMLAILADPVEADQDQSKHIDFKEATLLGLALSLNNIGGGMSAGILGISPLLIGGLSGLISIIIFWMGNWLIGMLIEWNIGYRVSFVAGLVLIMIGIKQMF
ncbi:MAG: sporulation membrane protein YtaF [Clostridia bacterium]|nr:sporulation membrane protein YtaF [Clostridia bacterium]